ncbi:MAG TPA: DUF1292 domain-containing protein [Erysipelotrichaceae bacterium]|nr:DUF1292 domain-containing protein [Erysipelotrichaceae bacterium]HQB33029.1 DUF1292 domain-containing protein [Erysipelotrichaceae bacterium]
MDDKLFVTTSDGEEKEMTILFTFESEQYGKSYVLFYDEEDETGETFAMSYDDKGNLVGIDDEEEWEMINEVFEVFQDGQQQEEQE